MNKEQRERYLRQDIHALRVNKFGWTEDELKALLKSLGYGESLTALDEITLLELKLVLLRFRKSGRPDEYTYDSQGMYMHSLMKRAGWNEYDLRTFLITHYRKSHWNLLDVNQRKAVIAMFQNYITKNEDNESKSSNNNKSNQEVSNGNETRDKQKK